MFLLCALLEYGTLHHEMLACFWPIDKKTNIYHRLKECSFWRTNTVMEQRLFHPE